MSDVAMRIDGLGKAYRIAHARTHSRYKTLQEDLLSVPRRLWSAVRGNGAGPETFWALRDVSFEVKAGEVLGIIGRNGAGKSTLLKILARITEPTAGRAEVYGRVGSLLEVGTGFHPELTGRENIYLSGAILGMTRREVQRKFDEIVAFADVRKFLDTPAKHYSSGMYMRLAFAVAAHLEPEILLVDEVLAVGDAEFQKKCLGKMGEVAQAGRTVLFVSHNLSAIQRLCNSALVLEAGGLAYSGAAVSAVETYVRITRPGRVPVAHDRRPIHGTALQLIECRISTAFDGPVTTLNYTAEGIISIDFRVSESLQNVQIVYELWHLQYGCVLCSTSMDTPPTTSSFTPGLYRAICTLPAKWVRPGTYSITLSSSIPGVQMLDEFQDALAFEVIDDGSPLALLSQVRRGAILPLFEWRVLELPESTV